MEIIDNTITIGSATDIHYEESFVVTVQVLDSDGNPTSAADRQFTATLECNSDTCEESTKSSLNPTNPEILDCI